MSAVQPFNRAMVENYLRKNNLKFLIDSDGDFRVDFSYEDSGGCKLSIWLTVGGRLSELLDVRAISDRRIPRSDWGRALMVCNDWNKEKRWPKAYLYAADPDSDATAVIYLENAYDLEDGVHQELLNTLIDRTIYSSFSFWEWAHGEQSI